MCVRESGYMCEWICVCVSVSGYGCVCVSVSGYMCE